MDSLLNAGGGGGHRDRCVKLQGLWRFVLADLEWRILYVGSAESEEHDQVLDTVLVGPLVSGRHKFVFQVRFAVIARGCDHPQ